MDRTPFPPNLYDRTGPFASVFLPLPVEAEDARHRMDVLLRSLRRDLQEAGGDEALVDRAGLSEDDHAPGRTLALLGAGAEPLVCRPLDLEVPATTRVDALPVVTPLLADAQHDIVHLVVLADRTGAEVYAGGRGLDDHEALEAVEGDTEHITRVGGGGWSHRRMQQRAENTWERNATEVAGEVGELARLVGARLIFAAGDERALGFLEEHLDEDVRPLVHLEHREPQGTADAFAAIEDELRRQLRSVAARDQIEVMERFVEARGRGEAADGPEATLAALTEGRVATLLVHDDLTDDRRGWFTDDAEVAATAPDTLADLGHEPQEGRLVDVAIRAALRTDADVRVVPGAGPNAPSGGLAALVRWT